MNGVAHAIGKRFRDLPITPEQSRRRWHEHADPHSSPSTINGRRPGADVPEGLMMIDLPARDA